MLYKINTIFQITSLSRSTIYRLIKEGRFPAGIKISNRRVAWKKEDIDQYIANLK